MYILVFTKDSQIFSIILSVVGKRTDYLMLDQLQSKKNIKLMQLRSPYSFFRTRILGIIQKISKFGADSQVWCPVSIIENKNSCAHQGARNVRLYLWFYGVFRGYIMGAFARNGLKKNFQTLIDIVIRNFLMFQYRFDFPQVK